MVTKREIMDTQSKNAPPLGEPQDPFIGSAREGRKVRQQLELWAYQLRPGVRGHHSVN
jgi:hypothetical protein